MNLLLGTLFGAAGAVGLYSSWRRFLLSGPFVIAISWLFLFASLWLWSEAVGAEFGISIGLLLFSLFGGLLVFLNFELRPQKKGNDSATQAISIDPRSWPRHLLLFVLVVPVAGVAATFCTVIACSLLPWEPANEMAFAVLLVPVTWGLAAYWVCADPRPVRPAMALLLLTLVSALYLYL